MPMNNRHSNNNMGSYGGQGVKRMRNDDFRNDHEGASHRMKWNPMDNDNNMTFLERNDVDQRAEYARRNHRSLIECLLFSSADLSVNSPILQ